MANVVIKGADRVQEMLSWYEGRVLFNRMRRAVRAGAKVFQGGIKAAVAAEPTGNLPESFGNVPAPKVSASRRRGGDIIASTRPKSPLFNIFEPGAEQHEISGSFLFGEGGSSSWDQVGRKRQGPFVGGSRVKHPGMKARPILPTAFDGRVVPAEVAIAHILFEPSGA